MGVPNPAQSAGDEPVDLSDLTDRERVVLDAAAEGLSARAIAQRLSISEPTVRSHLSTIYGKLGVAGRVELLARLNGLGGHRAAQPEAPRQSARWPLRHRRIAYALGAMVVVLVSGFLMLRPDLPPRKDLAAVSRLLDAGRLTDIGLDGETLTAVDVNQDRVRVEGVSETDFVRLMQGAIRAHVNVSVTGGESSPAQLTIGVVAMLLPLLALVVAVALVVRIVRRPPPHAPPA